MEILDILYLAWLSHSVAFLFEAPFAVELHDLFAVVEGSHEEEEAADYSPGPSLSVVTVENSYSLRIPSQVVRYFVTNHKESIKRGSFVIFPLIADHVLEHSLVYAPSADVYR